MEEKNSRLMLAIFLSFAIWMGINFIFFPPKPPAAKPPAQENTEVSEQKPESEPKEPKKEPPKLESPIQKATNLIERPVVEKKDFYKVTNSFLVQLSNEGARIVKFYIKNYKDLDGKDVLVAKDDRDLITFNREQFRAIEISRGLGFDFNIGSTPGEAILSPYNTIVFAEVPSDDPNVLIFSTPSLDGSFNIIKEYKFFPAENYFLFSLRFQNLTNSELSIANELRPAYFRSFGSLGPVKDGEMSDREIQHYFRYFNNDGSFKDSIDGMSNEGFFSSFTGSKSLPFETTLGAGEEGIDFFGTGSRYFIAVLDPLDHKPSGVTLDMRKGNATGVLAMYQNWKVPASETLSLKFAAYAGIRETDGMAFRTKELDPYETNETPFFGLSDKLSKSFNQGLTTPFRNAIVWIFKKMHDYAIPNYGWCIIVFSILFKMAFYPLNQKQAESMKKMQALKPLIDEINSKYANDPQIRQKKTLELYQEHKVNPMGGCLPLLIQIPIFVAMYTAFSDTIDLWKSPFLWISDLSEPDTVWTSPAFFGLSPLQLNVLPLIMVVTQIFQTKMTAVATDPNQKMLMYVMPVIMLFFFWSMPAGVTMYWTVQNILSILQQWYTNKFVESKKAATVVTTVVKKPSK
jgi:YidC/Oxa1 family membrane protein insertase